MNRAISLKDIREYYGKSTGLLSFMNLIFVTVIAAMGIYIADIVSSSTEENETQVFALYTVFIIGAILIILIAISCFMGRKGEYEAAFRFRKLLSVLSFAIGMLSLIVSVSTIVSTYEEWSDGYTASIFLIQLAGSIFTVATSVAIFLLVINGVKYYDTKKVAKDIPENMTLEKNNKRYMFIINLSYIVLSVSIFLMSLFFASEIDTFSVLDLSDNSKYSQIYEIIAIAGIITTVAVFLSGLLLLVINNKKMYLLTRITYLINTLVQLVFIVYSLTNISKDFVKANYPDMTYIIFCIILAFVSGVFAMKSDSVAKNS